MDFLYNYMQNKNTWGVKKCGANQTNSQARPKGLISAEVTLSNICNSLNDTQYYKYAIILCVIQGVTNI